MNIPKATLLFGLTATLIGLTAPTGGDVLAADDELGELVVEAPYSFVTAPLATTGIGYLAVTNKGETADRLIEIRADFADSELHRTKISKEGIAKMVKEEAGVEVPPGETVTFEPGGLHVMFVRLDAPLEEGDVKAATLVFEKAGSIEVDFEVKGRGGDMSASGHNASGHDASGDIQTGTGKGGQ